MITLQIDNYETLIDMEVILEAELETLGDYKNLSEREAETFMNLTQVFYKVQNERIKIREARIKEGKVY